MNNKKEIIRRTLLIILIIAVLSFICFTFYQGGKAETYNEAWEYYANTEVLLDSICNWNSSFEDTIMETDVYYNYEVSKDNFLNN